MISTYLSELPHNRYLSENFSSRKLIFENVIEVFDGDKLAIIFISGFINLTKTSLSSYR